jgi:hypothetical protein
VVDEQIRSLLPAAVLVDPSVPVSVDELVGMFVPPEARWPLAERIGGFAVTLVLLTLLAGRRCAGRRSHVWSRSARRSARSGKWRTRRVQVSAVLAIYAAAGVVGIPDYVLVIASAIIIGGVPAALLRFRRHHARRVRCVTSSVADSAGTPYRRLAASPLDTITSRLARKGMWAIARLRHHALTSFWRVNLVAGASHVRPANSCSAPPRVSHCRSA